MAINGLRQYIKTENEKSIYDVIEENKRQKKLNEKLMEENKLLKIAIKRKNKQLSKSVKDKEINIYNLILSKAINTLKLYNKEIDTNLNNLDIAIPIIETPKSKQKMIDTFSKMKIGQKSKQNLKSMVSAIDELINHISILLSQIKHLTNTNKQFENRQRILYQFIINLFSNINQDKENKINHQFIEKLSDDALLSHLLSLFNDNLSDYSQSEKSQLQQKVSILHQFATNISKLSCNKTVNDDKTLSSKTENDKLQVGLNKIYNAVKKRINDIKGKLIDAENKYFEVVSNDKLYQNQQNSINDEIVKDKLNLYHHFLFEFNDQKRMIPTDSITNLEKMDPLQLENTLKYILNKTKLDYNNTDNTNDDKQFSESTDISIKQSLNDDDQIQTYIDNLKNIYTNHDDNIDDNDKWLKSLLKVGKFLNKMFQIHSIPTTNPIDIDFKYIEKPINQIRLILSLFHLFKMYLKQSNKISLYESEIDKMSCDITHYHKYIHHLKYQMREIEKESLKKCEYWQLQNEKINKNSKIVKQKNIELTQSLSKQRQNIKQLKATLNRTKCDLEKSQSKFRKCSGYNIH